MALGHCPEVKADIRRVWWPGTDFPLCKLGQCLRAARPDGCLVKERSHRNIELEVEKAAHHGNNTSGQIELQTVEMAIKKQVSMNRNVLK
ncbi:hypothetical protein J6590_100363 [Homalodisca vitripennis]|nr:hypothetical protein J6590_071839 [Homalodisca vitripennis]KAG8274773.1 hypothetical protein J6590_100363 [Homalodisca vitripennis]